MTVFLDTNIVIGNSTPDALNLAAAIECGCSVFLTNDTRLSRFPDIAVEVLT